MRAFPHSPPPRVRTIESPRSRRAPAADLNRAGQSPAAPGGVGCPPEHRQYSPRFILLDTPSFLPLRNSNNRTALNAQKYGFHCATPKIKRQETLVDGQHYVRRDI